MHTRIKLINFRTTFGMQTFGFCIINSQWRGLDISSVLKKKDDQSMFVVYFILCAYTCLICVNYVHSPLVQADRIQNDDDDDDDDDGSPKKKKCGV